MFDIGMMEMFLVVILAIIVVGPKDLPRLLRSVGQFISKVRAMGQDFQSTVKKMVDEVELDEVTNQLNKIGNIPFDENDRAPDIISEDEMEPEVKTVPKSKKLPVKKTAAKKIRVKKPAAKKTTTKKTAPKKTIKTHEQDLA